MDHKAHTAQYEVHTSTREELNEGWVWVRNEADKDLKKKLEGRRRIVRISNSSNHIYCEALYVNNLDLKWFKKRFKLRSNDKVIFISQWYLCRLGFDKNPFCANLTINTQRKIWLQFQACLEHPQIVVLLSTVLGIIGVGLGLISVGLGLISSGIGLIAIPCWGPDIFPAMWIAGGAMVLGGLVLIIYGVIQLIKRASYAPRC
jgi:hypothetical protein